MASDRGKRRRKGFTVLKSTPVKESLGVMGLGKLREQ